MTKFILHGGKAGEVNPDNNSFFREMTISKKGKTVVLLNYFSREDSEVEKCAEQDIQRFVQNSENKQLEFEIADVDRIKDQLQRASAMYMRGGETARLVRKMKRYPEVEQLFEGKVIGGSSAGAYALVKYYWENDISQIGEGLGIFNIKAFCHFTPQSMKYASQLIAHKESLPLITLPNYKWVAWYK